ncbi:MAG: nicotinate phosphoribosyltransferase [Deltaproteobacteria bacterium]|nr:nicotinate phosphoribosyltransferase [Deltaproteobacteria bacterium]MBW1795603.1 nicotinate phosphoribosyltransferase [Deltaproteobacteria bacterium]MBW2329941.1 nicotinate phosphoribosyltransferase [Deltaproteobacteria bacterium]
MISPAERFELLTDLYELTMAASYFENSMVEPATFSLFIRNYPHGRSYFVAAGLEQFLDYVANFHFSESDLAYLDRTGLFSDDFLEYLKTMRFTGSIYGLAEGEVFFVDEPILEVTAPIIEAQILETFVINTASLQSMIATKAARCVHAARGRRLVDFSLRRSQGIDAGLKVARSTYIAGFVATSNVLAGKLYGIPISGTMAHSYISSFGDEIEAFRAFARSFPKKTILLIDTYDTVAGARKAAIVGQEMAKEGHKLLGVRLDSGDMTLLSQQVRNVLDEAGLRDVEIFASSGFDEYKIARTLKEDARIDAFGVGTKMGVSADAPYFDMAYKLVQYGERPIMKLSTGKVNLAGEKQVFRKTDHQGQFLEDIIGTRNETIEAACPLLEPVMQDGKLLRKHPSLEEIRERFRKNFAALDEKYKTLDGAHLYPVKLSARLSALQETASG